LEVIINGIVFLYSFSIFSLLVYGKTTDFCKLILYPATLLKLLMVSRSFGVESFGSMMIMSSAKKDILTVSLPICVLFVSCSHFITLARNFRTMLNRSGERQHPCLIPDLRGNGFSFSH
jgi:hypothetical protein